MKVSVNEAKWTAWEATGLSARNCATIQLVYITKFAFGPEKLPRLSRNRPRREILKTPENIVVPKNSVFLVHKVHRPQKCDFQYIWKLLPKSSFAYVAKKLPRIVRNG